MAEHKLLLPHETAALRLNQLTNAVRYDRGMSDHMTARFDEVLNWLLSTSWPVETAHKIAADSAELPSLLTRLKRPTEAALAELTLNNLKKRC